MPTGMKTQLERYLNMFNLNQNKKGTFSDCYDSIFCFHWISVGD